MERMTPPVAQMGTQLNAELVQIDLTPRKPAPKPAWLKAKAPMGDTFHNLKKMARELKLHTV
jgi:lipoyl synthase